MCVCVCVCPGCSCAAVPCRSTGDGSNGIFMRESGEFSSLFIYSFLKNDKSVRRGNRSADDRFFFVRGLE